jgi:O-antigen ligase
VFYWVIANQALILKAVGRNPTLTGRVQLWRDLLKMAQNRPLLGYGFKSFFLQNGPVRVVWQHIHWQAVHAHNGYLDTLMELGLVGLALVLIMAAVTAWHGFKWLRIHRTMEGMWPLAIITFILGYNLAEASFLRQNSFTWVVFVATAFGLSKQLKLHERSVRVAPYVSVKEPLLRRNGFGQSPVETC